MAAMIGRDLKIYKHGESPNNVLAAITAKTVAVNAEPVDITSDDDNGFRTLLSSAVGKRSVEITGEGVLTDNKYMSDIIAGNTVQDTYVIDFGTIGKLSGTFQVTAKEMKGSSEDKVTYSVTLQSSGAFTWSDG